MNKKIGLSSLLIFYVFLSLSIVSNPSISGSHKNNDIEKQDSPHSHKRQKTSSNHESEDIDLEDEDEGEENEVLPIGTVKKVKIFHLRERGEIDHFDALKPGTLKRDFEFESYDCRINSGARWFRRTQTKSKPHSWGIISRGTGQPIRQDNTANTGEHWIYFVKRGPHNFAITFGQGEFLKPECLDDSFGSRIVRNSIEAPSSSGKSSLGKNPADLGSSIRGKDYCLLTRKTTLEEIPDLCDQLLTLSQSSLAEAYQSAKPFLTEVSPPTPEVSEEEEEKKEKEEVPSLTNGESTEQNGTTYINFFGKTFKVKGEYEQSLNQFLKDRKIFAAATFSPFLIPVNKDEDEGAYNLRIGNSNKGRVIHMDKVLISKTEICDLFQVQFKAQPHTLFHVKLGTKGATLNHLFGQGNASGELLAKDEAQRKEVPIQVLRQSLLGIICDHTNERLKEINDEIIKLLERKKTLKEKITSEKAPNTEAVSGNDARAIEEEEEDADEGASVLEPQAKGKKPQKKRGREKTLTREFTTGKVAELSRELEKVQSTLWPSETEKEYVIVCAALKKLIGPFRYDLFKKKVDKIFDEKKKKKPLPTKIKQIKALLKNEFKSLAPKRINATIDGLVSDKEKLDQFTQTFDPKITTIVYGIGVDQGRLEEAQKKGTLSKLIPLGARINLVRYVEALSATGYKIQVKFIPDQNQKQKIEKQTPIAKPENKRQKSSSKSPQKKKRKETKSSQGPDRTQTSIESFYGSQKPSSTASSGLSQEDLSASEIIHLPPSFESPLETHKVEAFSKLNVIYGETRPEDLTLRDYYIVGPTSEDGDCFFHSTVTEEGQDHEAMTQTSATQRIELLEKVQQNEGYKAQVRKEILAEVKKAQWIHDLQDPLLEEALNADQANKKHEEIRDYVCKGITDQVCQLHFQRSYTELENDEQESVGELVLRFMPAFLTADLYNEADLLALIPDESIIAYVARHSINTGDSSSYIEIPVGRENTGLGSILAEIQKRRVHCFLYNSEHRHLTYNCTIGSSDSAAQTIAILYHQNHYWTLYHPEETEGRRNGIAQAAKNAGYSTDYL